MPKRHSIFVGFDPREAAAFAVTVRSMQRHGASKIPIHGIVLEQLRADALYQRPTEVKVNEHGAPQLWDVHSAHWMSTEFAISRFLTPLLAGHGLALFTDCDMLARDDVGQLFALAEADASKALWCVQHEHIADGVKMDGQVQTSYQRKNWSSVMLFNCEHAANKKLSLAMVNTLPGRDLHRFCWLRDDEIGSLHRTWNYLVGHTKGVDSPKLVHFTDGIPSMLGYERCEFAHEWQHALTAWARNPLN